MAKTLGKEGNDVKKKGLALVLALTLLVVSAVAGTLAWLTAESDTVVNTFTTSGIDVELTETNEEYKMIPGYSIHKDPKAKVLAGSEECYLFVKLEKSANFDTYMSYEVDVTDGNWTKLDSVTTDEVYYRVVRSTDINKDFEVLKGNCVTVKGTVTKDMMTMAQTTKPTLTITAYASQLHKSGTAGDDFTPAQAWANVTP